MNFPGKWVKQNATNTVGYVATPFNGATSDSAFSQVVRHKERRAQVIARNSQELSTMADAANWTKSKEEHEEGISQQYAWQPPDFVYGTGVMALHQEIEHFYEYVQPTPTEALLQDGAVTRIKDFIEFIWPETSVEIFGSFRTGLNLPLSDIDLVVTGKFGFSRAQLYELEKELIARGIAVAKTVCVLDKARVPVVKFVESYSHIKFDISFNTVTSVPAAVLMKNFKENMPEMPRLVMVLKQFLMENHLNEVYTGGISSYAITLMCINFLQQQSRESKKCKENCKLGMLLLKFFDYYGRKFDYFTYCISVRGNGDYIEKKTLHSSGTSNWQSVLSIEDPIMPTNDIGRNSFAALYVKRVFERAFVKLSKLVDADTEKFCGSILGALITVPSAVINYRSWVHRKFEHLTPNNGFTEYSMIKRKPKSEEEYD